MTDRYTPAAYVIDASVARAAGERVTHDVISSTCRKVLSAVLDTRSHCECSDQLSLEWKTHASRFARKWRTSMHARRLWSSVECADMPGFRKAVQALSGNRGSPLAKDAHLIEAAWAGSRRIISLDAEARRGFSALAATVESLGEIAWSDPRAHAAVDWVRANGPLEPSLLLGENE